MTGQEYTLRVMRASKHGKYEYCREWTFTIVPIDVVSVKVFDALGKPLDAHNNINKHEKKIFISRLKEFLFRKETNPVQNMGDTPLMWHLFPEFDAETRKEIKRMYLFEEL